MPMKRGRGEPGERFIRAGNDMKLYAREIAKAGAKLVQDEVVARVPVRTGRLRELLASEEAIQPAKKGSGYVFGLVTSRIRRDGHYAFFVEYGTKGYTVKRVRRKGAKAGETTTFAMPQRKATPFFRPGVAAARDRIKSLFRQALDKATENNK